MSALLQISDTHFGTEQAPVVDALERFVRSQPLEALILSGDITQRAKRAEFDAARRFVDRLGVPRLLAIPGNHDIPLFNLPQRLFAPYAGFKRAFGDELEPTHDSPGWLVLTLKTTRRWRHKDGVLSDAQVERVASRLAGAAPGQLRLVVVHQPIAVTRDEDRHDVLHGAEPAVRRWAASGADVILGGHIHLPFVVPLHGAGSGLARRVWAVQAGTAVSSRLRHEAGNSVNLLRRGDAGGCIVERWDYRSGERAFGCVERRELALGACDAA